MIFWCELICGTYITWPKHFEFMKGTPTVCCVVVVGALTHCALLHSVCDLKATQTNVKYSLIWEFKFYEFKFGYNTEGSNQIICCVKG